MKLLLDEMLPVGLAALLTDHRVTTGKAAGFVGLKNGELIRRATADQCDVLVTADRNLPAQQNVRASGIAVILVPGTRLAEISPKVDAIRSALEAAKPGTVSRVR